MKKKLNNNYNGTQLFLSGNTCDPKFIKKIVLNGIQYKIIIIKFNHIHLIEIEQQI
jgi:hypothetical protein